MASATDAFASDLTPPAPDGNACGAGESTAIGEVAVHQVRGNSSSRGVDVRPCIAADVAALTADEPPGARLAEHFFARQQTGEVVYLIGWLNGNPVGTGVLATGDPAELKNLHVRKSYRGRGIGAEIVAAAERIVRTGELVIGVSVDNPDARRLYERLGYRPTGRLKTATYHYVDADGVQREATETAEDLEKVVSIGSLGYPERRHPG